MTVVNSKPPPFDPDFDSVLEFIIITISLTLMTAFAWAPWLWA